MEDIASDERREFRVATIAAFVVAAVLLLIPYVGGVSAWITLTQKMGGQTCAYFVCTTDLQGNLRYSNNTRTVDIPFCSSHSQCAPRSIGVPGAFWRIGIVVDAVGLAMAIMLGVKLLGPDRPGKWRDKYAADSDRSDPDKPTLDRDEAFMLLLLGLGLFTLGPWLTMVVESATWYV